MYSSVTVSPQVRAVSLPLCGDSGQPVIAACSRADAWRTGLEHYIAAIFYAAYGATVMEYLPLLCSVAQQGVYQAALGLRSAASGTLFCEQYLDREIDYFVAREFGRSVRRDQVMELGNLVASRPGTAVWLYLLVIPAMRNAGFDFLSFAANRAVMASIRRCGFDTRILCDADPARLGDRAAEWGSYYDGQPKVVLADLRRAVAHGERCEPISHIWSKHARAVEKLSETIWRNRL